MTEHQGENRTAPNRLNKALWIEALDHLEQVFFAFQQRSSPPVGGVSARPKPAQKLTHQPKQLVLDRGGLSQEHGGFDPSKWAV